MQLHVSSYQEITVFDIPICRPIRLLRFQTPVECGASTTGFASPADDYIEDRLDLNEFHNIKQHTTFLVRATGESMLDAGITDNDLLIVDTTLSYREGDIVICCLNNVYKAKIIQQQDGCLYLVSRNPAFAPIPVNECDDFRIFGVVKGLSRNFRRV